ncbi:hypothetical protein B0T26DRAFT_677956 [Lasiosphaeria miniovina]|uniref:Uncharacterized protein n=1 Tax=Lasiosphaeria miniovina TaxID=1954250 RepID=A0AA40AD53_9PEZI|nr:uncharacterized protein B0T26DRAFT_677956 [Lasiosphaeria miniovina]KAK0713651.1 hypothetical protein B0T26DRAFT_677956 [Lasiosphaeria miniovina]
MPTSVPAVDNDRGVELSNLSERGNNVTVASLIRDAVRAVVREEMLAAVFTSVSAPTQASSKAHAPTSAPKAPPPSYDTASRTPVLRADSAPRSEDPRPLASGTPPATFGRPNSPAAGFATTSG